MQTTDLTAATVVAHVTDVTDGASVVVLELFDCLRHRVVVGHRRRRRILGDGLHAPGTERRL